MLILSSLPTVYFSNDGLLVKFCLHSLLCCRLKARANLVELLCPVESSLKKEIKLWTKDLSCKKPYKWSRKIKHCHRFIMQIGIFFPHRTKYVNVMKIKHFHFAFFPWFSSFYQHLILDSRHWMQTPHWKQEHHINIINQADRADLICNNSQC